MAGSQIRKPSPGYQITLPYVFSTHIYPNTTTLHLWWSTHAPFPDQESIMSEAKQATNPQVVKSFLPEFVSNSIETVNSLSRVALKTATGLERAVEGIDETCTLMLNQQRARLALESPNA